MSAQHLDDSGRPFGILPIVLPVIWTVVAVVGFLLIASSPELFVSSAPARRAPAANPAATFARTDAPTPDSSKVLRVLDSASGQEAMPALAWFGEREQMLAAMEAMPQPQLKAAFLRCDRASNQRMLDLGEAVPCAMAWDALLKREFGGNVDAMLAWWRAQRDDASGADVASAP